MHANLTNHMRTPHLAFWVKKKSAVVVVEGLENGAEVLRKSKSFGSLGRPTLLASKASDW